MYNAVYPVLASQTKLPFYLSGIGCGSEYHICRDTGLVSFQILFTRSGSGILRVDGLEAKQTPGCIFFLSPGVPHEYFPESGDWETAWVVFRGGQLPAIMESLGFGRWHEKSNAELSGCENLFSQLMTAVNNPVSGGERCSMLLYEYILEVRSLLNNSGSKHRGSLSPANAAVEYMDREFNHDITLEELSALSGITLQHFCRVFHSQTGMRPMEYLARRRIAEAKKLLLTTELSIAEIASMTGYSTPTYFGVVFRRCEGISPSEYRKSKAL